jgi:hypothetical protein
MVDEEALGECIRRDAGEPFETKTGKAFTYDAPGTYLRISRDVEDVNRSISRSDFAKAAALMPTDRPGAIKERQGSAYTWAILMDERIRGSYW